jgi:flagellar motility protein MotE (MotC chaperone)
LGDCQTEPVVQFPIYVSLSHRTAPCPKPFDRLTYIDRLTAERQARAHAEALDAALRESVATKGDVHDIRQEIADVRQDLRQIETRLEAKIETTGASLKVDILRWLIVTQTALAGFAFAAAKFVK